MKTKFELDIAPGAQKCDIFDPLNAPLLKAFETFLISEDAIENLYFAQAVRDMKDKERLIKDPLKFKLKVLEIYRQYIGQTAKAQINISPESWRVITSQMVDDLINIKIFDTALAEVEKNISTDNVRRFVKTTIYTQALKAREELKKQYDNFSEAYEHIPENQRSDFVSKILQQEMLLLFRVKQNIYKYNSGKILYKFSTRLLQQAQSEKAHLLIRQQALQCLIVNRLNPDLWVSAAKEKVQSCYHLLQEAQIHLERVEQFPSMQWGITKPVELARRDIEDAKLGLEKAKKELEDLTFSLAEEGEAPANAFTMDSVETKSYCH